MPPFLLSAGRLLGVVLQLVVFLVGRIAIFSQFHQQLRRPLAMFRSGAAVLVHAGLFAALERCGLLEPVPGQSNGKAQRYYLNLPRPKEPNKL